LYIFSHFFEQKVFRTARFLSIDEQWFHPAVAEESATGLRKFGTCPSGIGIHFSKTKVGWRHSLRRLRNKASCVNRRAKSETTCPFFPSDHSFSGKTTCLKSLLFLVSFGRQEERIGEIPRGRKRRNPTNSASQMVLNAGESDAKRTWNFPQRQLGIPCFSGGFSEQIRALFLRFTSFFWGVFGNSVMDKFLEKWLAATAFFNGNPTTFFEEKWGFGRLFVISSAVQ